jgi:hypothetical protein
VVNPFLERRSNTIAAAGSPLERSYIEELADEILVHRDQLGRETVVLERGDVGFNGFGWALTLELIERGVDVGMQPGLGKAVHPDRRVSRDTLTSGLVLVIAEGATPYPEEVPGELVAEVATAFDREAYLGLLAQLESADKVVLGNDLEQAVDDQPNFFFAHAMHELLAGLPGTARDVLNADTSVLRLLRDHPPVQPTLDPALLDRLIDSMAPHQSIYQLEVYLLHHDELVGYGQPGEIG